MSDRAVLERAAEVCGRRWACCELTGSGPVDPPCFTISGGEELRRRGLGRPGQASGSDGPGALVGLWTDQESEPDE
ncbi:hypothetical protein NDU88_002936 [Pleurodeles waltl]|uniref:Uncharacterized protein n=1 Tax=Pleurodeles waltl TaxID=8319 RepID=A0AAV7WRN2_PLEWA|nr:hypothetical protein NDU88_002936 [Pleurodeles waltl]